MQKLSKLFLLFYLLCTTAHAQTNTPQQQVHYFSLQQCLDFAKANNVQVKNALLNIQQQEQTNREITSAAYPRITANASLTDNLEIPVSLVPGDFFGQPGTFVPLKFGVKYSSTIGIELSQILFDGQVFVGLQARTTSIDFQKKYAEITEENIRANVGKVYYQLVLSKTQLELLDANITRLQKLLSDTREIYKNGFAEKVDVDKLSVQLANLQTEHLSTTTRIKNGYTGLKVLMGMPVKDSLVLTDQLTAEQIKADILQAADFKYEERRDFQYALLGKKLNEYNIKRYKLGRIPTVTLNGYYNKNAQRERFDIFGKGDWFSISAVTVRVSVPLFSGFFTQSKIAQAKLSLKESENNIEALKLSIDNDVSVAQSVFAAAIATIDFQKKNMDLAEVVYNQTKKKYEAGTGSSTEINAAQVDLKTAQTNYINALYQAIIAKIDYLKAVGKL